jgi:hypothetical protein
LRFWAYGQISEYRCGDRQTWDDVVAGQVIAIAAEVRAAHPAAAHPYTDAEALDTAKSVAGWVWLRYVGGQLTRVRADTAARREKQRERDLQARRARGAVPRDVYLAEVQRRRSEAHRLRGLGVTIAEIAHRLSAGVSSVHRWLSEYRCLSSSRVPSDFERPRPSKTPSVVSDRNSNVVVNDDSQTPGRAPVGAADGKDRVSARSAQSSCDEPTPGRGVRGATGPMAYIRRRIAELVNRGRDARPP